MNIIVASAFQSDSSRAHAINVSKMAQGFARLGHRVTLICRQSSKATTLPPEAIKQSYGIKEPIGIIQLPVSSGEHWLFSLRAIPAIIKIRPDLLYARNYILPWLTSKIGIPTVAETHAHPDNRTSEFKKLIRATTSKKFKKLITISQYLGQHYSSIGAPSDKISILPDAVDLQGFSMPETLPESPFTTTTPNILYSGHLYDYKGIPCIIKAAKLLPQYSFHLLGGLPEDIERHSRDIKNCSINNITLHGNVPHSAVPPYLWHADCLLLPPSMNHPSAQWTSPVKLGEYMASGTPIVATKIPAFQDWIDQSEVHFCEPDNAEDLAKAVQYIIEHGEYAANLSAKALVKAAGLDYSIRAQQILEGIHYQ